MAALHELRKRIADEMFRHVALPRLAIRLRLYADLRCNMTKKRRRVIFRHPERSEAELKDLNRFSYLGARRGGLVSLCVRCGVRRFGKKSKQRFLWITPILSKTLPETERRWATERKALAFYSKQVRWRTSLWTLCLFANEIPRIERKGKTLFAFSSSAHFT